MSTTVTGGTGAVPADTGIMALLAAFGRTLRDQFFASFEGDKAEPPPTAPADDYIKDLAGARTAIADGKWDKVRQYYQSAAGPDDKRAIRQEMLTTATGQAGIMADPEFGGRLLGDCDAAFLGTVDFTALGTAKDPVIASAVLHIAGKYKYRPSTGAAINRDVERDTDAFKALAALITPDRWNDPATGLGTRTCQKLWQNEGYDEACTLIEAGVDTKVAAVSSGGSGGGVYSGFVQPLQHIVQGSLRDIDTIDQAKLAGTDSGLTPPVERKAEGARKILAAMKARGDVATVTTWKEVTDSDMLEDFKRNPGTIWGFEDVRMPFVQAAHDTNQGAQPLRMMEIWEAVEVVINSDAEYQSLLGDPASVDRLVDLGVESLKAGMASSNPSKQKKFADLNAASETYRNDFIAAFRRDATSFLNEFAAQMPKATFARPALDGSGAPRSDTSVSSLAGIVPGKFQGGLACKAGLWQAKTEGKPVFYCLDGINMEDVTNYKAVKNKAIADYLDPDKRKNGAKGHDEVITLVELREILKNWDELKSTVKFVDKGKLLSGSDLDAKVAGWQANMATSDKVAGRAPAPPKAEFANELAAIDSTLLASIPDGPEGDKDGRDIVRKCGYLTKVARTRPAIVLKYVISKCGVLVKYGLIPQDLIDHAITFRDLATSAPPDEVKKAGAAVLDDIAKCNPTFNGPLGDALLKHPMMK